MSATNLFLARFPRIRELSDDVRVYCLNAAVCLVCRKFIHRGMPGDGINFTYQ